MAALTRFAIGIGRPGTIALATTAADLEVMSLLHGPRPGTVVD
ncbi:hypothetical protein [Streptomyces ardesiacus]